MPMRVTLSKGADEYWSKLDGSMLTGGWINGARSGPLYFSQEHARSIETHLGWSLLYIKVVAGDAVMERSSEKSSSNPKPISPASLIRN